MSRKKGLVVTCERCGTTAFIKCTGEGETDGGYTRWNKFEPLPEGWGWFERRDLCPECNRIWQDIQREFEATFAVFMDGEATNEERSAAGWET